jgi:1-acyl-sn-glycerol-3-phosphate acyltransferase
LGCLYYAATFYVMSPLSFLARPQSWLWAIHRFRGTLSAAPNFAFELCLSKINDSDLKGLDLSSLRFLGNGAEPVSVASLGGFIDRFAAYGFRPGAMAPVYGLAENAVAVTLPPPGRSPVIDRVNRVALNTHGIAEPAEPQDSNSIEVVACGQPIPGHEIRIVDEMGRELAERREGRLEFRGPSATLGYFQNPAKTRELFRDGWLDTGDRAYIAHGDLFVTGRIKDIIIRAGQHIAPHEIEEAVGAVPGLRKNAIAAFGVADPVSGTERVVVLAETDEKEPAAQAALRTRSQEAATHIVGGPPDEIVLVPPGTVPKTASGKIRRTAARDFYLGKDQALPRRALWRQIAQLAWAGAGVWALRLRGLLGEILYAGWWWSVMAASFLLGWAAVMSMPVLRWRWGAIRRLARLALKMLRIPLAVSGIEKIPPRAIVAFNHASYMDAVIVAAVLPGEPSYVVKKELAAQLFAGTVLRRLGVLFLDRFELTDSLADLEEAAAAARKNRVLVFFPEGTFTRRPGLSEFYLGAFRVAAQTGLPVLPAILRGTRSVLRSDQWFPRWSPISVTISDPIPPPLGTDLASVVQLRDAVRAVILAGCGEPDLGELIKPAHR